MNKQRIISNNLQKKLSELNNLTNEIYNLYKQNKKLTSKIKEFYTTYEMIKDIALMKTEKQKQQLNNNVNKVLDIINLKIKSIKAKKNGNKSNRKRENSIQHLVSETLIVENGRLKIIKPIKNTTELKSYQRIKTFNNNQYNSTNKKLRQNTSYKKINLQKQRWKF